MRALRRKVSDSNVRIRKEELHVCESLSLPVPPLKPHDGGVVDEKNSTARPEKKDENECTF
jgi:hypothetical protein